MLKLDKKYIKIVSVAVAAAFVLGIVGIAVTQSNKGFAAGTGSSNIGVVNQQVLVNNHPDYQKSGETFRTEAAQKQKDVEAKLATLTNDKDKQDEIGKYQEWAANRQKELISPIVDQVNAAIKQVADAKGLAVVLDVSNVVYGGQDITDEVGKKISGK